MSTGILYIRVSTDEQAVRGYSQRSQTDRLVKYCAVYDINIHSTIFEDYSAKTFNRPEWIKLFEILKIEKTGVNLLLFTSWDRFSRNIADAYYIIHKLKKLGVVPQAIDQPIDLTIPESKIMLAMYLATSEVENDRKSNSVRLGIHRAKQEGKWIGKAPLGYQNTQLISGQKHIILHEPEASLLRNVFEVVIRDEYSINYIYKQSVLSGLKCSRTNFWSLLRNPVYCGKIIVPEFGEEKRHIVDGVHESLISALLFDQVQKVLNKRKQRKNIPQKIVINEQLILRGFLLCPDCGNTLTGSGSQGHSQKYYYYHCSLGCRFRVRADMINRQFLTFLKNLKPQEPYIELSQVILKDLSNEGHDKNSLDQSRIALNVEKLLDRIVNAHDLFSKGDIDYNDYMTIKSHCQQQMKADIKELQQLAICSKDSSATSRYLFLHEIYEIYKKSDALSKRQFLGLIFPGKIVLRNDNFETMVNQPMRIIFDLKNNSNCTGRNNTKEVIPAAEEKYLKIIAKAQADNEIIMPKTASETIFFLKKVIFCFI